MGTNYYLKSNICKCCNRPEEKVHIGKSSGGWQFCFRAYPERMPAINNYIDWIAQLEHGEIEDEYGRAMPLKVFMDMVEAKKHDRSHHRWMKENDSSRLDDSWVDRDGHTFCNYEFS